MKAPSLSPDSPLSSSSAPDAPAKRQRVLLLSPAPASNISSLSSVPLTARVAEPQRHAGEIFYQTLELRQKLFDNLDRKSLLGLLRLEKGIVPSIAQRLYRRIPASLVSKMSRIHRDIYAEAVRIIDRSPPPHLARPSHLKYYPTPTEIQPETLLDNIFALRMAFPNLQTIEYEHPESDLDDAYVIRFEGDQTSVHLEKRISFDIHRYRRPPDEVDLINPHHFGNPGRLKVIDGVPIPTTIALHVYYYSPDNDGASFTPAQIAIWKAWLYDNPKLDKRVTSITMPDILRQHLAVCDDDTLPFLNRRREEKCEPVRRLQIPLTGGNAVDRIAEYGALVGPEMRTLHLDSTGVVTPDWQKIITACDHAFPNLESLSLSSQQDIVDIPVALSGLPKLKFFEIAGNSKRARARDLASTATEPFDLALRLSGVGRVDCMFRVLDDKKLAKRFHSLVRSLKSSTSYDYLHSTTLRDLDIWDSKYMLEGGVAFTPGNKVRRQGWVETARRASDFSKAQTTLNALFEEQKAAAKAFQEVFAGTVVELSGKEGDLHAQGEIIKRRFETLASQDSDIVKMRGQMEEALSEMEQTVESAGAYARKWLAQQESV